jgi:hypothetical protein
MDVIVTHNRRGLHPQFTDCRRKGRHLMREGARQLSNESTLAIKTVPVTSACDVFHADAGYYHLLPNETNVEAA